MKRGVILFIALAIISTVTTVFAIAVSNQELVAQVVSFKIFSGGTEVLFKKPIVTINDSTYIPLREAAEILGMDVNWNEGSRTISINNQSEVLYPFEADELWGYKDRQGKVVVEPKYFEAHDFKEGLALVRGSAGQNGQYGYIDTHGNVVIPCTYYMAYDFNNDVALVSLATNTGEDRWTYIDKQGNLLFDKEFVLARNFSENYAAVLKEGYGTPVAPSVDIPKKWTYIDKSGNFATELDFEDAQDFKNGLAPVKNNGKWGMINTKFELVVDYLYDDINDLIG